MYTNIGTSRDFISFPSIKKKKKSKKEKKRRADIQNNRSKVPILEEIRLLNGNWWHDWHPLQGWESTPQKKLLIDWLKE